MTQKSTVFAENTTKERFVTTGFTYTPMKYFPTQSSKERKFNSSDSDSIDLNQKKLLLLLLIQIFGVVDILLLCIYICIFVQDRVKEKMNIQSEIPRGEVDRDNTMYDDIELVFL